MKAFLVAGLGFGDEGKGSIVDALVRQTKADLVVRYNGGAQAAHHVVTSDGKEHCFSQFGSGTLAGARTYLSEFMMVEPAGLLKEASHLEQIGITNPLDLLTIHPETPIITPYHIALNRLREIARDKDRHGSCGLGIGELGNDLEKGREIFRVKDLLSTNQWDASRLLIRIANRLFSEARHLAIKHLLHGNDLAEQELKAIEYSAVEWLRELEPLQSNLAVSKELPKAETIVFEGAQGVLLDEIHGFHPHTTWSNCTFTNALYLLAHDDWEIQKIGVTRGYATRHGAGPFPTEILGLQGMKGEHNGTSPWQGQFRVGHLDFVLLKYALEAIDGVDMLAVTCMDHLKEWRACVRYNNCPQPLIPTLDLKQQEEFGRMLKIVQPVYSFGNNLDDFYNAIEIYLNTKIGIISTGPTEIDKELYALAC